MALFPPPAASDNLPLCEREDCRYTTRAHHQGEASCGIHRHPGCPFNCGGADGKAVRGRAQKTTA